MVNEDINFESLIGVDKLKEVENHLSAVSQEVVEAVLEKAVKISEYTGDPVSVVSRVRITNYAKDGAIAFHNEVLYDLIFPEVGEYDTKGFYDQQVLRQTFEEIMKRAIEQDVLP